MKLNIVGGMPKSGSTLFCNILNQNPAFHASDTSPVGVGVRNALWSLTSRPEFTSELAKDEKGARARVLEACRGVAEGWYSATEEPYVFDKDRSNAWAAQHELFHALYPESIMVLLVRDPREVLARILHQRRKDPMLLPGVELASSLLANQEEELMGPRGLVGMAASTVENTLREARASEVNTDYIKVVAYEQLVNHPKRVFEHIYESLELDPFEHDFDDVKDVSQDLDVLYRNQWLHKGSGKVVSKNPTWPGILPPGLAQKTLQRFPLLCSVMQYR